MSSNKINDEAKKQILDTLPSWKTKILSVKLLESSPLYQFKFFIDAKTSEEVQKWIEEYQNNTFTTYRIRNSMKGRDKIVFKKLLNCHHNSGYVSKLKTQRKTKNTKCPSRISVKLFRSDNSCDGEMFCEITLIPNHNHETKSPEILKHRPVDKSVIEKIWKLFDCGYGPKSALEYIKMDISLNNKNPEDILIDRKYCPDYNFYLHLYQKFKKKSVSKTDICEYTKTVSVSYDTEIKCKTIENKKDKLNSLDDIVNNLQINNHDFCENENCGTEKSDTKNSVIVALETPVVECKIETSNHRCKGYRKNIEKVKVKAKANKLLYKIMSKLKIFLKRDPNESIKDLEQLNDKISTIRSKIDYHCNLSLFKD